MNDFTAAHTTSLRAMSADLRVAYTRRVLGYVATGLATAFIGARVGMMDGVVQVIAGLGWFIHLAVMIGLVFWAQKASTGRHAGTAYFAFSFGMGLLIGPLMYFYTHSVGGPQILGNAVALTAINVTALAVYTWVSKKDFSFMGGFLFIGLLTMIGVMLLNLFIGSSALAMGLSAVGVLLFNGFLLYDLGRVMNSSTYIPPTQAALSIFLDIFNLFLFILNLLGGNRE